ncbi:ornithine cyclodeaminase [Agrococcus baldri]|uniref:Ornithine cyclodeaminase n=1 Tax=Agrococcus baldri TaxID=153730 RepID=A0AA94KZX0_9MICO|nr:ornithine cyclodeaminase [Agrococcus baldri]SFS12144.1 ornithine cyclodeaminase [Agrococcus baldri]
MTTFVGVADMAAWTRDLGPERIIEQMSRTIEQDFARWQSFDLVPRIASHTPIGVIELMPTSDGQLYAFKYVNGHPSNPGRGYQTVTAFGALADVDNGYPVLLAEMTLLTALRTAATSAMASRILARPGSKRMAMIGAGSQAEFQALGHRAALGIQELAIWDVDPAAMRKAQRNLEALGFTVRLATSGEDAVRGADVITTCTADKALATVLFDEWIEPGVHINAIGGDCPGKTELEPAILRRGPVFVEHTPQTRVEGEIQHQGDDFAVTELWQVIAGSAAGRESDQQVTIFDSVGFAIEDFSALRFLHERVQGTGHSIEIDLVAEPEDPKDLWGIIGAPVPAV